MALSNQKALNLLGHFLRDLDMENVCIYLDHLVFHSNVSLLTGATWICLLPRGVAFRPT